MLLLPAWLHTADVPLLQQCRARRVYQLRQVNRMNATACPLLQLVFAPHFTAGVHCRDLPLYAAAAAVGVCLAEPQLC
jgi:hypothetical protein